MRGVRSNFDMIKFTIIVGIVSLVALTTLAFADMGGHGMDSQMMDGHHMMKCLTGLNLDEKQKASIGEIKSRMMKDEIRRTADLRIVQIELNDLLCKEPVDMKAVEAKVKQSETMRTEMKLSCIKDMEDIKAKLTSEQRKNMKEMMLGTKPMPMMEGMEKMHDEKSSIGTKGK